jgi:hypothetical protein
MIRLAWRQMRLPAISTAILLATLVVLLALTEHSMNSYLSSSGLSNCLDSHGSCRDLIVSFEGRYGAWATLINALSFAPALAGLFWGAPLIAREVEQGTHRLAWSQSVSRRRWFAIRAGLYLTAAAAVGALLTWLFTWWYGPLLRADYDAYNRIQPRVFESRGIVLVATMLFSFALGTAAGAVIRRTVPAMAVALAGFAGERVLLVFVRSNLLPPKSLTIPFGGGYPRAGLGDWMLDTTLYDGAGHASSMRTIANVCAGESGKIVGAGTMRRCAQAHGFHEVITYQPLSRFWPLQGIESGILAAAAVLLLAIAAWWTLRRIS